MSPADVEHFMNLAREAAERAYCPYSGFRVGCVLLGKGGEVFRGCNIESCAYSPTICAERTAAASAIAQGVSNWEAVFVVSPTSVSPCGVCRQFLHEFSPELHVYIGALDAGSKDFLGPIRLTELLPLASGLQQSSLGRRK
ncbi:MAG: cytidine deaminase [Planctomycetota bacterium]|jgi:cytidine deaminase